MKMLTSVAGIILFSFLSVSFANAGNPLHKSEKMKPAWLVSKPPKVKGSGFSYQIIQCDHPSLSDARKGCMEGLIDHIDQVNDVQVEGTLTSTSTINNTDNGKSETINREYVYKYHIESKEFRIHFRKIDEYWEVLTSADGKNVYRCHILYAVSNHPNNNAQFDTVTFSYKYGFDALWRSALVPGYGQLHKGHKAKGIAIMGGEAAFIGGIIFSEKQSTSYRRKVKETLDSKKRISYTDKADNYETARNICIGGAAAVYIYSLIDAVATDGRKRTITNRNFNIYPSMTSEYNGISLSLNF